MRRRYQARRTGSGSSLRNRRIVLALLLAVAVGPAGLISCRLGRGDAGAAVALRPTALHLPALRLSVANQRAGAIEVRIDGEALGRVLPGRTWSYPMDRASGAGPWRAEIVDATTGVALFGGEVTAAEPVQLEVSDAGSQRVRPPFLDPAASEGRDG